MNIRQLKNIMKEVNEPNEFFLEPDNLQHPLYWIFKADNIRIKTLFPALEGLRNPDARFDVLLFILPVLCCKFSILTFCRILLQYGRLFGLYLS